MSKLYTSLAVSFAVVFIIVLAMTDDAQIPETAPKPAEIIAANTARGVEGRTIRVDLVDLEQLVQNNRLGAQMPNAQIYALRRDVIQSDHALDSNGQDSDEAFDPESLQPGYVRLRSYKRPRPLVLRANVGIFLISTFRICCPRIPKMPWIATV